jgi:hypothetical protein
MSLVNALINQIGREIGRDIYQTTKRSLLSDFGSKRGKSFSNLPVNEQLIAKIEEIQRSKSKLDLHQLRELMHSISEHVDVKTGDWDDVFVRADQLIDAYKINEPKSIITILEYIDQLNLTHYRLAFQSHKKWILDRIEVMRREELYHWSPPNRWMLFFFSLFGCGSSFLNKGKLNTMSEFFIPWLSGLMVYAAISLSTQGNKSLNLAALLCFLFYCLTILGNFIKRGDLVKIKNGIMERVNQLKLYYEEVAEISL